MMVNTAQIYHEKQTPGMNTCLLHAMNNLTSAQIIDFELAVMVADHMVDITTSFGMDDEKEWMNKDLPYYTPLGDFHENVFRKYFDLAFKQGSVSQVVKDAAHVNAAMYEHSAVITQTGDKDGGFAAHFSVIEYNTELLFEKDSMKVHGPPRRARAPGCAPSLNPDRHCVCLRSRDAVPTDHHRAAKAQLRRHDRVRRGRDGAEAERDVRREHQQGRACSRHRARAAVPRRQGQLPRCVEGGPGPR